MLQKEKSSEWDGSAERVNRLIVLAERELSAFFAVVNKNFGAEQASKSATDWLEELEVMDWPTREQTPNWRQATLAASLRLSASSQRKLSRD
jgi:hypothetical protein